MVQESPAHRQDAAKQPQSPFDLHKNELLVKAAELTGQYGVDLALLVSTPTGQAIKYSSSGPAEVTLKRLQEMPVSDVLTRDQVVQHWQAGDMPTPPSQWPSGSQEQPAVTGQWQLARAQAGWLQLAGPQRRGPGGQPQGQAACVLPALRAPGFLDAGRFPVPPAAEAAYRCLTQELDRLTEAATTSKRRKLQEEGSSGMQPAGHQAASDSGRADAGAAGLGTPHGSVDGTEARTPGSGGGLTGRPSRFKPLSVELPGQSQAAAAAGAQPGGGSSQQGVGEGTNQGAGEGQGGQGSMLPPQGHGAHAAGGAGNGGNARHDSLQLDSQGMLALPSPSDFITSGRQSLAGLSGLNMDMPMSARGGHAGAAGRPGQSEGDLPAELADTPNSSAMANLNGFIWSPASSGRGQGLPDEQQGHQEGGAANAGSGLPAGGAAPELMVLGKGLDTNSRLLADSKGAHGNASTSANLNALNGSQEEGAEAGGAGRQAGAGLGASRMSQSGPNTAAGQGDAAHDNAGGGDAQPEGAAGGGSGMAIDIPLDI